ncbi:MAG: hypothetical protein JNK87_34160 [Bryobacterales bacterium]|nr:hypothetical protein [Bryobacterales bacterium]
MPKRFILSLTLLSAPLWLVLRAAPPAEPSLVSVFPFGGQKGTSFKATIRGRALDRATAVWFDCEHLSATIAGVAADPTSAATAPAKGKGKKGSLGPLQLLTMEVTVALGADAGVHSLRVLTPAGVSNAIPVRVHAEPAMQEPDVDHSTPTAAHLLSSLPVVVSGKLTGAGELDYYAFDAKQGETLRFDGLSSGTGLDPGLTLYELTGSWFKQDRLTELAFNDEDVWYPGLPAHARITYKFAKSGRYLIRVSGFLGEGRPDYLYQLSVRRDADGPLEVDAMRPAHQLPSSSDLSWRERTWKRELKPDRLRSLWARAATQPADRVSENIQPLQLSEQAVPISLPALLEGTIAKPAQVHRVKFAVKANDRISVEVETLRKTVPEFNPYLRIVSVTGDEAFTNVHSTVNTCGDTILKQIQPKTTYSFPRAGEFILEIRDITHAYAGPEFGYRVFIRHQVPHVGEVHVGEEQMNLVAGEVAKMNVQTDQEEGFDGQIALTVEGLPPGVRAAMGTDIAPQVPPPYNPGKVERFQPESQKATFLFMTDAAAPPTAKPVEAKIVAQPVANGKLGRPITVKTFLVTVVQPATHEASK